MLHDNLHENLHLYLTKNSPDEHSVSCSLYNLYSMRNHKTDMIYRANKKDNFRIFNSLPRHNADS